MILETNKATINTLLSQILKCLCLLLISTIFAKQIYAQNDSLGINVATVNETRIFKNLMDHAQIWYAVDDAYPFSGSLFEYSNEEDENYVSIEVDPQTGYPSVELPFSHHISGANMMAMALIFPEGPVNGEYQPGRYTLMFDGDGEILIAGDPANAEFTARILINNPNPSSTATRQLQIVPPQSGESLEGIFLAIRSSNAQNPVRNIRIMEDIYMDSGSEEYYVIQPFNPEYLEYLRLLNPSVIRTMNFSSVVSGHPCDDEGISRQSVDCINSWSHRITPNHASQNTDFGVAVEYMVDLANILNADLWLNFPHAAEISTDTSVDYVSQMASLVGQRLEQQRRIYIEYSAEVWNTAEEFLVANQYTQNVGMIQTPPMTGEEYFVYRQADAIHKFTTSLGTMDDGRQRVVSIMPSQGGNAQVSVDRIRALNNDRINPHQVSVETIAVAAYFGIEAPHYALLNADGVPSNIQLSDLLDFAQADIENIENSINDIRLRLSDESLLPSTNLPDDMTFIAYEGGQHLVPLNIDNGYNFYTADEVGGDTELAAFVDLLQRANRSPRMTSLYQQLFDVWFSTEGTDRLILFQGVGPAGSDGQFGIIENLQQVQHSTPKLQAVLAFSPGTVIGEVGRVEVLQSDVNTWFSVDLNNSYDNPIIIMGPVSFNDPDGVSPRLRNVVGNQFEFQLQEWSYLDGERLLSEVVPYIVIEAGIHQLENGSMLIAGQTSARHRWSTITFPIVFDSNPVVMSQVASTVESTPVTTRHRRISDQSFSLKMKEEELLGRHSTELIHWIAVEQGSSEEKFEVAHTGRSFNHNWNTLNFSQNYTDSPITLMAIQSHYGGDTSNLRIRQLNSNSVQVLVQEEQSRDSEVRHTRENVGYMTFANSGDIIAPQ